MHESKGDSLSDLPVGSLELILEELRSYSEAEYAKSYAERLTRFADALVAHGIGGAVLTLGADVPWLVGYEPMPLERITALIVVPGVQPTLLVPELEAARVRERNDLFTLHPWREGFDPYSVVTRLLDGVDSVGVSERGWAGWLLRLGDALPSASFSRVGPVLDGLRRTKDRVEVLTLAAAAAAADRVAAHIRNGELRLEGRTEREVAEEIGAGLRAYGHAKVNFGIVGSGENSASPHHEPTERRIRSGDAVVCDFGGTFSVAGEPGYCSDITRTFHVGEPTAEFRELFEVLEVAQAAGAAGAVVGCSLVDADRIPREIIADAGFGGEFIHRTGHGIGLEEHEEPYLAATSTGSLLPGDAFSVEPGIYRSGRYGARIEDIVVADIRGPILLNRADHSLGIV